MKLLYDFRAYQEFYPRGVSRYVYELFVEVIKRNEDINGILITAGKIMPEFPEQIKNKVTFYQVTDFEKDNSILFDFFVNGSTTWLGLTEYNSIDVLYPESVLRCCRKKVCLLYDFVPLLYSNYLPTKKDQINYFLQCEAIKYMDHIFTISNYVSSSGARYLHRTIRDFTCLYGGADFAKFYTENSEKEYNGSMRSNNLVNVSGVCVRKNFDGVTKAFCNAYLSRKIPQNSKLIIICSTLPFFVETIKNITENMGLRYGVHVVTTGFISDKEMVNLIANAKCSIYPSYYEGLGLPILESYTAGTPCIASNVSSMKELVLEKASFNPFDVNDMTQKIIESYNNEQLCIDSLNYGRRLIKKINWCQSAEIMINKLKEIL